MTAADVFIRRAGIGFVSYESETLLYLEVGITAVVVAARVSFCDLVGLLSPWAYVGGIIGQLKATKMEWLSQPKNCCSFCSPSWPVDPRLYQQPHLLPSWHGTMLGARIFVI